MKKMIVLMVVILVANLLTGCGIFNFSGYIIPDDLEFLATIKKLDTPEKTVAYMCQNFEYKEHAYYTPDPYILWKTKKGNCNDFAAFAQFAANYHGYKTYQIKVMISLFRGHVFAVYEEGNKYSFSSNYTYFKPEYKTFRGIVEYFFTKENTKWNYYEVYDYEMNIVEVGYSNKVKNELR